MGLITWKNAPEGRIIKSDTNIAKNYLSSEKILQLERTVSSYFDYIEGIIESVNHFFEFNEYEILPDYGKVKMSSAKEKAN